MTVDDLWRKRISSPQSHVTCLPISDSGGAGNGGGLHGEGGTVTGKKCPKGLYGTYCTVCLYFFVFAFALLASHK